MTRGLCIKRVASQRALARYERKIGGIYNQMQKSTHRTDATITINYFNVRGCQKLELDCSAMTTTMMSNILIGSRYFHFLDCSTIVLTEA